jgi:hypothetical protein
MRRTINSLVRPIIDPNAVPLLFIIGAVLTNLIGSALFEIARGAFGDISSVLVATVSVLLMLLLLNMLRNAIRAQLTTTLVQTPLQPRSAVIALVSQGSAERIPAADVLKFHAPACAHGWLITTAHPKTAQPQSKTLSAGQQSGHSTAQTAWQNAQTLQQTYQSDRCKIDILSIDNAEDIQGAYAAIRQVLRETRRLGYSRDQIAVDITGGTKVMSVAVALACNAEQTPLTFLRPSALDAQGRATPDTPSEPRRLDIAFQFEDGADAARA